MRWITTTTYMSFTSILPRGRISITTRRRSGRRALRIGWHTDPKGRICALIDSAAKQHTLSGVKSVCELFYERDILVNADVDKDLFSGIARVKSYLNEKNGLPSLYIFSSCVNLIRELKSYFWGSGDVPKKTDDHALDALRYYLMSRPKKLPPAAEKTAIQRDKERRWRQIAAARNGKGEYYGG